MQYKVSYGDTLYSIAQKFLGDGNRYIEISRLNKILNPNLIHVGDTLYIPTEQPIGVASSSNKSPQKVTTLPFQFRQHQLSSAGDFYQLRGSKHHGGIDFSLYENTILMSCVNGKVISLLKEPYLGQKRTEVGGGFGRYVTILDSEGFYWTYAHMSKVIVLEGSIVTPGTILGYSGGTITDPGAGYSFGAHLHLQIGWQKAYGIDNLIDPWPCLREAVLKYHSITSDDVGVASRLK